MRLFFQGEISIGNPYRHLHAKKKGHIWIGKSDLLSIVSQKRWKKRVCLTIILPSLTRRFSGENMMDLGFSHSINQQEKDFFYIGKYDILAILSQYEQKNISLILSDEENFE
jgi:hypothetical protein